MVFFIDNGRELYGFGAVVLVCREFVDCAANFDSFGQDSLSELVLSPSAAAAASLTKQIWRFLPANVWIKIHKHAKKWTEHLKITTYLLVIVSVNLVCVQVLLRRFSSNNHPLHPWPSGDEFPHGHYVSEQKIKTHFKKSLHLQLTWKRFCRRNLTLKWKFVSKMNTMFNT